MRVRAGGWVQATGGKPVRNALQVLQTSLVHTVNVFPAAKRWDACVETAAHQVYLDALIPAIQRMNPGATIVVPGGQAKCVPLKEDAAEAKPRPLHEQVRGPAISSQAA